MKKLILSIFITSVGLAGVAGIPVLQYPNDKETGIEATPTLRWIGTANDSVYHIQVSLSSTFNTTIVNDSTITLQKRTLDNLLKGVTYYWRVRARGTTGGWSAYTSTRRFTVVSSISPVPLVYPPAINYNMSVSNTFYKGDSVYIGATKEKPIIVSIGRFGTSDTLKCIFVNDSTNVRFILAGNLSVITFRCYVPFIRMKTTGATIVRVIAPVEY